MKKLILILTILCFFITSVYGTYPVYAQDLYLPAPGALVNLSPEYNPSILKGIKVHPDNPLRFDFILDQGDSADENINKDANRLIKYFLASLTIPEKDLWVNLSPYEKDRIIPDSFGLTEMGRDLLAEDYMLKQITASLIYPEGETGRKFWERVYAQAARKFGTTSIPVNTFNKVWIVPEKAVVYENAKTGTAYVIEAKLKVMLEQDYLSMTKHAVETRGQAPDINHLGSEIIREIVIPELTREVNDGKNFSQLRQVYNSLILATWYKRKVRDSILGQVYTDKKRINGVGYKNSINVESIYQRYLKAFKKGVYNYIKEEQDSVTGQTVPRKYFSGGVNETSLSLTLKTTDHMDAAQLAQIQDSRSSLRVTVDLAMSARPNPPVENPGSSPENFNFKEFIEKGVVPQFPQGTEAERRLYAPQRVSVTVPNSLAFHTSLEDTGKFYMDFILREMLLNALNAQQQGTVEVSFKDNMVYIKNNGDLFSRMWGGYHRLLENHLLWVAHDPADGSIIDFTHKNSLPQPGSYKPGSDRYNTAVKELALYSEATESEVDKLFEDSKGRNILFFLRRNISFSGVAGTQGFGIAAVKGVSGTLKSDLLLVDDGQKSGSVVFAIKFSKDSPVQFIDSAMVSEQSTQAVAARQAKELEILDRQQAPVTVRQLITFLRAEKGYADVKVWDVTNDITRNGLLKGHEKLKKEIDTEAIASRHTKELEILNRQKMPVTKGQLTTLLQAEDGYADVKIWDVRNDVAHDSSLKDHVMLKKDVDLKAVAARRDKELEILKKVGVPLTIRQLTALLQAEEGYADVKEKAVEADFSLDNRLKNYQRLYRESVAARRDKELEILNRQETPVSVKQLAALLAAEEGYADVNPVDVKSDVSLDERLNSHNKIMKIRDQEAIEARRGKEFEILQRQKSPVSVKQLTALLQAEDGYADVKEMTVRSDVDNVSRLGNHSKLAAYQEYVRSHINAALADKRVREYLQAYAAQTVRKKLWAGGLLRIIEGYGIPIPLSPVAFYKKLPPEIQGLVVPKDRIFRADMDGRLIVKVHSLYRVYNFSKIRSNGLSWADQVVVPLWDDKGEIKAFEVPMADQKSKEIQASVIIEGGITVEKVVGQYLNGKRVQVVVDGRKNALESAEIGEYSARLSNIIDVYVRTNHHSLLQYQNFLISLFELESTQGIDAEEILEEAALDSGVELGQAENFIWYLMKPAVRAQGIDIQGPFKRVVEYLRGHNGNAASHDQAMQAEAFITYFLKEKWPLYRDIKVETQFYDTLDGHMLKGDEHQFIISFKDERTLEFHVNVKLEANAIVWMTLNHPKHKKELTDNDLVLKNLLLAMDIFSANEPGSHITKFETPIIYDGAFNYFEKFFKRYGADAEWTVSKGVSAVRVLLGPDFWANLGRVEIPKSGKVTDQAMINQPKTMVSVSRGITVEVQPDVPSLSYRVARGMADTLIRNNDLGKPTVFICPTGGTQEGVYAVFIGIILREHIDFTHLDIFNMDEYYVGPRYHGNWAQEPHSYRYYLEHHLVSKLRAIDPRWNEDNSRVHYLNGQAPDIKAEIARYENEFQHMRDTAGIDLEIGGIGRNGHIAFNEPIITVEDSLRMDVQKIINYNEFWVKGDKKSWVETVHNILFRHWNLREEPVITNYLEDALSKTEIEVNPMNLHFLARALMSQKVTIYLDGLQPSDLDELNREADGLMKGFAFYRLSVEFKNSDAIFNSRTRAVELSIPTIVDNSRFFTNLGDIPLTALTIGLGTVLDAKKILIAATGPAKQEAVYSALAEPESSEVSASVLQRHKNVTFVIDAAAARVYRESGAGKILQAALKASDRAMNADQDTAWVNLFKHRIAALDLSKANFDIEKKELTDFKGTRARLLSDNGMNFIFYFETGPWVGLIFRISRHQNQGKGDRGFMLGYNAGISPPSIMVGKVSGRDTIVVPYIQTYNLSDVLDVQRSPNKEEQKAIVQLIGKMIEKKLWLRDYENISNLSFFRMPDGELRAVILDADQLEERELGSLFNGVIFRWFLQWSNFDNSAVQGLRRQIETFPAYNGGIDLTPANMNLQTQNAGEGIKFHLDPAMMQQLQNTSGFVPVIINIQPMADLRRFLGVDLPEITHT